MKRALSSLPWRSFSHLWHPICASRANFAPVDTIDDGLRTLITDMIEMRIFWLIALLIVCFAHARGSVKEI